MFLLGTEGTEWCTTVPHLEREEVIGFAQRKLDLPGSENNSHGAVKVNFPSPSLYHIYPIADSK